MVSILVKRSKLTGSVRCPSSKSYTHRAIAIASLCEGNSRITNSLLSRDTLATIAGCRALGASIKHTDTTVRITGKEKLETPENVINAENSGTTIRILASMSSLVKEGYTILTGDESLRRRPMQPILEGLRQLGVQAFSSKGDGTPPLVIKGGGMKGGFAEIDGSVSSQFISGLLIAGIFARSGIKLKIGGSLVSRPYVNATIATMQKFGVSIDHAKDMLQYNIKEGRYSPCLFDVPSDFSTAALILSAGALAGGNVLVTGLDFNLPQGDSKIVDILRTMGCEIRLDADSGKVEVLGSDDLSGGEFHLADTPDLLPVVSILALKARTPVTIRGVAHARAKETDRVANIASELKKFGAATKEFHDGLTITAPKKLKNVSLEAYDDHRLFMAFTIAAMLTERSIVAGAESVDVSYPTFISDMVGLGGRLLQLPDRE